MKRAVCICIVLLLCLAAVPFASADQSADGIVVSIGDGSLSLELSNGNIVVLSCSVDTDAAAGDSVTVTYTGRLGISAEVVSVTVLSEGAVFSGTIIECGDGYFTVRADNGARILFLVDGDTYLTGSVRGLTVGMEVEVSFSGDITEDVYASHIHVTYTPEAPEPTAAPRPTEPPAPTPVKKYGRPVTDISSLNVGDPVTFGTYEQDNIRSNGKEDIEWTVLDIRGRSALLLSDYGLDMHVFNDETARTNWSTCSMRSWLNSSFYNTAFSAEDKQIIETVNVDNSASQGDRESVPGPNTRDKVFLLSYKEAWNYLPSSYDRMCIPTDYALSRYAMSSGKYMKNGVNTTYWWLRTSGRTDVIALLVMSDGSKGYDNVSWGHHAHDNMYSSGGCIRPAVWVTIG